MTLSNKLFLLSLFFNILPLHSFAYESSPWDTRTSAGGAFSFEFLNEGSVYRNTNTAYRSYSEREKEIILKAANTLERTFANVPYRAIQVRFYIMEPANENIGAASTFTSLITPLDTNFEGSQNQKTSPTFNPLHKESNLSTVEYVWKYQINESIPNVTVPSVVYPGDENPIPNPGDIKIGFANDFFTSANYSEQYLESTALHEMAHAFGFAVYSTGTSAIQEYVEEKTITSGGREYTNSYYTGEKSLEITDNLGVKFAEGNNGADLAHIGGDNTTVMLPVLPSDPAIYFSDSELAVLQDMGWEITEEAWRQFAAIPEPSMFGLFAGLTTLALVGTRRRRK